MRFLKNPFLLIRRSHHININISSLLTQKPGENVTVRGWIQNIRKMKNNVFADINDGSTCYNIQAVFPRTDTANLLNVGDSVEVKGLLGQTPKEQLEIKGNELKIVGECQLLEGYPFTPKQVHPPEYVRQYLHLRSKVNYMRSLFRIRHRAVKLIHDYMDEVGLTNIHTPVLTANDCEGAGETFTVTAESAELLKQMKKPEIALENAFFDKRVFLSVSGQLSLEAMCHGLGDVYTLAPTFRAENSRSNIHLSEFYMLEAEFAFVSSLDPIMDFIETFIKRTTERLLDTCENDLSNCSPKDGTERVTDYSWLQKKWNILSYDEAFKILEKGKSMVATELKPNEGFSKEQELFLVRHTKTPVFVVNWPKDIKPFYMKVIPSDPFKVYAVDLLMPVVGELAGGSLRENDYNRLKSITPQGLEWYLDLRKFGGIPTGGFGLGFDRYLQLVTGVTNIRDAIPFPRYPHSCAM